MLNTAEKKNHQTRFMTNKTYQ